MLHGETARNELTTILEIDRCSEHQPHDHSHRHLSCCRELCTLHVHDTTRRGGGTVSWCLERASPFNNYTDSKAKKERGEPEKEKKRGRPSTRGSRLEVWEGTKERTSGGTGLAKDMGLFYRCFATATLSRSAASIAWPWAAQRHNLRHGDRISTTSWIPFPNLSEHQHI